MKLNIKSRSLLLAALLVFCCAAFSCCSFNTNLLDSKNPVTLTMWCNYGGHMKEAIDALVEEFNDTVGRERGVIINITAIQAAKDLDSNLLMIANGDPGAPQMPDIVTAYPSMAHILAEAGLIMPLDNFFTGKDLGLYLPQFIAEGRLSDGGLYVFPVSKSTEALFVNRTLFDRFSEATGIGRDCFNTFEGIANAAEEYYKWTDAKTPNIAGDGKAFFTADSWFNVAQVGTAQLGGAFVGQTGLNIGAETFTRIWNFSAFPVITGGFAVTNGYSSDLSKTGDIICSIGSTAGVLFYGDTVTYQDNTKENVVYDILPYPVFNGGEKIALQRGAGMIVAKTTEQKGQAAAVWLKWFTSPEQNLRFVSTTGYLPVMKEAFEKKMSGEIEAADNDAIKKLLQVAVYTYENYEFVTGPGTNETAAWAAAYEAAIKAAMRDGKQQVSDGKNAPTVSGTLLSGFLK